VPELIGLAAVVVIAVILGLAMSARLGTVTIYEWQRGLRFENGKFQALVDPGRYRIWRPTTTITPVDVRASLTHISGQELVTSDGITVKISLAVQERVADPVKALLEIVDYREAAHSAIQIALREVVAGMTGDEVLAKRSEIGAQVFERSVEKVAALGLELTAVDVRDLMLPAATKRLYAQIVEARQRGLAALEQARGETAALRSLANAANLIEKSPTLFQLRLLQQMEASSGNTFVVGTPTSVTPLSTPSRPDQPAD
jgi:regulator of protease activity HflC (stomatin/prohibitin superfamily)